MNKIVVVGSISMDLVVTSFKRPTAGETVIGEAFHIVPGGKGANQAVAAARLGASVEMIGAVGKDQFGDMALNNFTKEGVSISHVKPVTHVSTGTAHIVLAEGDNSIVVVPGANFQVDSEQINTVKDVIQQASIVLLQLEIPLETVEFVANLCHQYGIPVVLNPAPAQVLSDKLIEKVNYLTPNEHECRVVFESNDGVENILKKYPNKVILTEGSKGVRYFDREMIVQVPALSVEVVDTTGAGDTFNAGFAVALAQGLSLKEAVQYGSVAAGLSVTKLGAQSGMPTLDQVKQRLGDLT